MKQKSIARRNFGENLYEKINKTFPGIEGSLFLHLDPINVMFELVNKTVHYNGYYLVYGIDFRINQFVNFRVSLNPYNKRIGLGLLIRYKQNNSQYNFTNICKEIQEKLNLYITYNKAHTYNDTYDFKYNQKNCQNIIKILNFLVAKDWPEA